jgi:hypothetical protein
MSESKSYRDGYKDGIKFSLLIARMYGADEKIIKRLESEYSGEEPENALKLKYGETYLIYEKRNRKGMEIVWGIATQGFHTIVMSRETKNALREFENVKFIPITYDESTGGFNPTQLGLIQEFIINNFAPKSVLYVDCLDYLFSIAPSVQSVIKFLTVVKDKVVELNGIFILSVNKDVIGKAERSMVEKEFKNTLEIKQED